MTTREAFDAVIHLELAETNRASGVALDDLLDVQHTVFFLMEPDDVAHISPNRWSSNAQSTTSFEKVLSRDGQRFDAAVECSALADDSLDNVSVREITLGEDKHADDQINVNG